MIRLSGIYGWVWGLLCLGMVWMYGSNLANAQSGPLIETGFERQVNRYRWIANASIDQPVASWQLTATNRFVSDAFLLFDDRLNFRDENRLSWRSAPQKRGVFQPGFQGQFGWFSQSRVWSQDVFGLLSYSPSPSFSITPMLGFTLDHRPGSTPASGLAPLRKDSGPAYGYRISYTPPPIDQYQIAVESGGTWQRIDPRKGRDFRLNGSIERQFDQTRLATRFGYSNIRRDAYRAVSFLNRDATDNLRTETIEATTSDTLNIGVDLEAPIYGGLNLATGLLFGANNRIIRTFRAPEESLFFDTNFHRRAIQAEVGLRYRDNRYMGDLMLESSAESEERQLANRDQLPASQAFQKGSLLTQADYDQSVFTLRWRNQFQQSDALGFNLEGSASILRHNTPEINPDDRDEALYTGRMGVALSLSPYFQAELNLAGSYYHTVYLKAQRSAENNVQRSLRFSPLLRWLPSDRTRIQLASEVRATYTVDDFVLPGRLTSDQSAREIRYALDVEQAFQEVRIVGSGTFSDLHLGRFLAAQFAEIPFDTLRTYGAWVRVQTGRTVAAEVGARLFVRTDYDRASSVTYQRLDDSGNLLFDDLGQPLTTNITRPGRRWIEQIGPTTALTWSMSDESALQLEGWMNVQRIRYRLYGDLPEGLEDHIRATARRGTRRLIPNLSVTAIWRL